MLFYFKFPVKIFQIKTVYNQLNCIICLWLYVVVFLFVDFSKYINISRNTFKSLSTVLVI